jgi:hypothetical protein
MGCAPSRSPAMKAGAPHRNVSVSSLKAALYNPICADMHNSDDVIHTIIIIKGTDPSERTPTLCSRANQRFNDQKGRRWCAVAVTRRSRRVVCHVQRRSRSDLAKQCVEPELHAITRGDGLDHLLQGNELPAWDEVYHGQPSIWPDALPDNVHAVLC